MVSRNLNLRFIGYPDFFNNINNESFDLNNIFWRFIFSNEILNLKIFLNLSYKDRNNLIFLLKNIKLSYNIFTLFSKKDIEIYHLIFAFHIINELLNILNKYLIYEKINFYGNIEYKNNVLLNIEDSLTYKFLSLNKNNLLEIKDETIFYVNFKFSSQFYQLKILQYFYKKNNIKIYFNIDISNILEFENKLSYKKILYDNLENIINFNLSNNKKHSVFSEINNLNKFLGHKNLNYYIFNKGCYYRKCTFCNIGKFGINIEKDSENIINDLILANKSGLFDTLHIGDPDIQPEEIRYVCQKFIDNNADIKIHIRTRFSKDYDTETLDIMYRGGVRFMGVGLENCSKRLNKLMNKSDIDLDINYFEAFIENCFKSKINIHLYTIFGFPTETKEEIDITRDFLMKNFKKYPFFTYTAGLFGLSKGTYVYDNPEKFNLNIKKSETFIETFIQSWSEKNVDENSLYLYKTLFDLQNILFFKSDYNPGNGFSINNSFWYFIENSRLFHIYKMYYSENPFLRFCNINNEITIQNFKSKKYKFIDYHQFLNKDDSIYIKNWVNFEILEINDSILGFLKNFNEEYSLNDNLKLNLLVDHDIIYKMIKSNFFLLK